MAKFFRSLVSIQGLLVAVSGVLVFLAYPNYNHDWLAWFAYAPLLVATRNSTVRQGFWLGLVAGTITNAGGFHWITQMLQDFGHLPAPVTWAILGLQAVTQGLAFAVGIAMWRWLVSRGAPNAFSAMLGLWFGEATVPMIFPWFLGNAISNETLFVQIAELGGVHIVSALLYASNAAIFDVVSSVLDSRKPAWKTVGGTVAAVAITAAFGAWRIADIEAREEAAPKLKIGLVEGDIGIWEKQAQHLRGVDRVRTLRNNLLIHQQLSAKLEDEGAELIVWPESAYMPYGPVPVFFSADRFLTVGNNGAMWRHDGNALIPIDGRRNAIPSGRARLTGLSSPRGDVRRFIADGKRVITVAPWVVRAVDAPGGETFVDTVSPAVTMFGAMKPGLIATRSGRVYKLPFDPEPLERDGPQELEAPALHEIPGHKVGDVDIAAMGRAGGSQTWLVGRKGALAQVIGNSVQRAQSPTDADLWDVAGDPLGSTLVAVGAHGTILSIRGSSVAIDTRGGKHLYAAFYDQAGNAWAGGEEGTLLRKQHRGRWQRVNFGFADDILAGAADASQNVLLLGRAGAAWHGRSGSFKALPKTQAAIHAVVGLHAKASYTIPRMAKRIQASRVKLPAPDLAYPDNVIADDRLGEFDRSSPRRGFKTPLLFGALTYGGVLPRSNNDCRACYNSALLIDSEGKVLELTDKAFLLVFGEYMPFGEEFPKLYEYLPESSRFQPGTRTRPLVLGNARIGVLVCYEDLLPRQAMKVAAHDPNVFINLTNDAWFGQTAEPEHHLQLAQLRTVEYRRWLVRSTNTGISVFIDALGRRRQETELTKAETLMMAVPLLEGRTVYALLGDWPLVVLAIVLFLVAGRALRRGERPKKGGAKSGSDKKAAKKTAKKPADKNAASKKRSTSAKPKAGKLKPKKL